MTFPTLRNIDTERAVQLVDSVKDVALVELCGVWAVRIEVVQDGQTLSTYIAADDNLEHVVREAATSPWLNQMPSAELIERSVAEAIALDGVDDIVLVPVISGYLPSMTMMVAGVGSVLMDFGHAPGWTLTEALKKERRFRVEDAEGRMISRLGAMSFALVAKSSSDLDIIIDTVFTAGTISYRGISSKIGKEGRLVTSYSSDSVRIRSDGIEIGGLPDTIKTALRSGRYKNRPLADLVDVDGFTQLRIAGINGRAAGNRTTQGGAGWLRIDVRDVDGAQLDDLDIQQAKAVAQETYARRVDAQARLL